MVLAQKVFSRQEEIYNMWCRQDLPTIECGDKKEAPSPGERLEAELGSNAVNVLTNSEYHGLWLVSSGWYWRRPTALYVARRMEYVGGSGAIQFTVGMTGSDRRFKEHPTVVMTNGNTFLYIF